MEPVGGFFSLVQNTKRGNIGGKILCYVRSVVDCSCSLKTNIPGVSTAVPNREIRFEEREEAGAHNGVKAPPFKKGNSGRGVN